MYLRQRLVVGSLLLRQRLIRKLGDWLRFLEDHDMSKLRRSGWIYGLFPDSLQSIAVLVSVTQVHYTKLADC
jgi:hypothetical protein